MRPSSSFSESTSSSRSSPHPRLPLPHPREHLRESRGLHVGARVHSQDPPAPGPVQQNLVGGVPGGAHTLANEGGGAARDAPSNPVEQHERGHGPSGPLAAMVGPARPSPLPQLLEELLDLGRVTQVCGGVEVVPSIGRLLRLIVSPFLGGRGGGNACHRGGRFDDLRHRHPPLVPSLRGKGPRKDSPRQRPRLLQLRQGKEHGLVRDGPLLCLEDDPAIDEMEKPVSARRRGVGRGRRSTSYVVCWEAHLTPGTEKSGTEGRRSGPPSRSFVASASPRLSRTTLLAAFLSSSSHAIS